eukprot:SAG11_NODE_19960_length_455_cov_1.179775_1_plen_81_part_10
MLILAPDTLGTLTIVAGCNLRRTRVCPASVARPAQGQPPQPANEAYENQIALVVRGLLPSKPLWIEHEGEHVGANMVPAVS